MADNKKKLDLEKLSDRQRRILEVIRDAVILRGYPPSIREIGDAVGLNSTSSVAYQLKELEKKGYLRRDPHKPRAVDVRDLQEKLGDGDVKPGPKQKSKAKSDMSAVPEGLSAPTYVPVVGQIAAGNPILAEQHIEEHMALPTELVGSGELYLLRIVGESMVDAGIFDGDWVVVKSQNTAEQGDFIAAMIEGDAENEATVKEWRVDSAGTWLWPHNRDFEPIRVDGRVTVLGRVVSVLRSL